MYNRFSESKKSIVRRIMNNLLYIYEEVIDLIKEKNLDNFEREGARDKFLWQFEKSGSTLHVDTVMHSRYVLYATEKDYNLINRKADEANLGIVLKESKKDMIELMVSQYESVSSKAILFIRNGNKGLLQNPDVPKLPHVIYLFTNENLEFVLDCIKEGREIKAETAKKKTTTTAKAAFCKVVAAPKPKMPEMTDEEIKDALPEGCEVAHSKYGHGIIQAVLEGKVKVLFEDSIEKTFAAQVCIEKNLLTVIG